MGPKDRWEKERQDRKSQRFEEVVCAAERVFIRKGIEKATMQDVAKESNIGIATVFRYFPKKDTLIVAVVVRILESQLPAFEAIANMQTSCLGKIEQLLDLFISYTTPEHQNNTRLIEAFESYLSLRTEPLEGMERYEEVSAQINESYYAMINNGTNDGSLRTDVSVADAFYTIVNSFGTYAKKLSAQQQSMPMPFPHPSFDRQLHLLKTMLLEAVQAR